MNAVGMEQFFLLRSSFDKCDLMKVSGVSLYFFFFFNSCLQALLCPPCISRDRLGSLALIDS